MAAVSSAVVCDRPVGPEAEAADFGAGREERCVSAPALAAGGGGGVLVLSSTSDPKSGAAVDVLGSLALDRAGGAEAATWVSDGTLITVISHGEPDYREQGPGQPDWRKIPCDYRSL